ncbi:hypothetical protein [Terrimonas ferruginea]|uniref:hypothetical protein n=1 Tax=Terrimonas ferruginea TaxID=249 RepID=UPI00040BD22E|nr:hypothetical protein [Terrimonas ferruginea]
MKAKYLMALCFSLAAMPVMAQTDSTGLPGDNFSLEAALDLFKNSASPEAFEKALNTEGNNVNNLDLNGDGDIDYIRVIDHRDGDVHTIVLQATISASESQDVAVIELEKTGENTAVIQIVGDEDLYGEEKIVEPEDDGNSTSFLSGGTRYAHGPAVMEEGTGIIVNVWFWPSVRFVYAPAYVIWTSPWTWRARPMWWRPWRPVRHSVFYVRYAPYRPRYVVVRTHRIVRAPRIYRPVRVTSVTVYNRHQASVTRYRSTRRTTTINNGRTHNTQGRVTQRTTTTRQGVGPRKVKTTKTTTVRKPRR